MVCNLPHHTKYNYHFKVEDLEMYHIGNSSKCIIWNYDWFGFDSGRARQMCDFLAAHGKSFLLFLNILT